MEVPIKTYFDDSKQKSIVIFFSVLHNSLCLYTTHLIIELASAQIHHHHQYHHRTNVENTTNYSAIKIDQQAEAHTGKK